MWHLTVDCPTLAIRSLECFGPDGPENGNWEVSSLIKFVEDTKITRLMNNRPGEIVNEETVESDE